MQRLTLIELTGVPIYEQLQLEEALLRCDTGNWCLINRGSPPAIVMGISGNPELLVDEENYLKNPIPLLRRYSGGGTVVVDHDTLFVSLICRRPGPRLGRSPGPPADAPAIALLYGNSGQRSPVAHLYRRPI